MKELLRIYDKIDGDVLAIILNALCEMDYTLSVGVDAENGCMIIKDDTK